LPYTLRLAAVLSGNLLCLAVLNGLRLPASAVLRVWPAAVIVCWYALRPAKVRRAPCALPGAAWWMCGAALALLTVPRLTYFAEWLPGAAVLAQADDYGRLAELVAMTQSERYPLAHPANGAYLLSHYYTALFPLVWIKFAVPLLTLKDCIVVGNFFYHALILLALLECAPRLARRRGGALLLVFLMTLFGGLDIVMGRLIPFEHTEHWARAHMGRLREISSFYTAAYWTVHHTAAMWAVIAAFVLTRETRYGERWRKPLVIGWLLVAAGASSAFVALTLPLVGWREMWTLARRLMRAPAALTLCAAGAAAPVWLVLRRVDGHGFQWYPPQMNLLFYVVLICVIDLAGIPIWIGTRWKGLSGQERRWMVGCALLVGLSWGVESAGYNNFLMRGGLVPVAAMMVVFARRPAPKWLLAVILATTVTTVREAATLTYWGVEFSNWYWQGRGLAVPAHVLKRLRPEYARIARDRAARYYQPDAQDRTSMDKYNAERRIQESKVEDMHPAEREILRRQ
jgi:hypothetical protein